MSNVYNIDNFDFDSHIDYLIDIAKSINKNEITIVTGPNGYGKSFLRKLVGMLSAKEEYDFPKVASASMERRTVPNYDFSALSSMMIDKADDATSNHTVYMITSLLEQRDRYCIIDEPEIGMGKEVLLGFINDLNETIQQLKDAGKFCGVMFITHDEFFIDHIKHDRFINLTNLSYPEWKNREIVAISPKDLETWCLSMWRAIEKRLK